MQNVLNNIFKSTIAYIAIKNSERLRSTKLFYYLSNWIVNRLTFTRAIKTFVINTKTYWQTPIYVDFFFFSQTRKLKNLTKKESILQSSKPLASRIAIRFQKVNDTSILKRNRRSFDFSILILSIFLISFV